MSVLGSPTVRVALLVVVSVTLSVAWMIWDVEFLWNLIEREEFIYLVSTSLAFHLSAPMAFLSVCVLSVRKRRLIYLLHLWFYTSIYAVLLDYAYNLDTQFYASIPDDELVSLFGAFADRSAWILGTDLVVVLMNAVLIYFAIRKLWRLPNESAVEVI